MPTNDACELSAMIRPEPCGDHHPAGRLGREEQALGVDAHHLVPVPLGHVERWVVRPEPGVGDEDVELPVSIDDLVDRATNRRHVAHVERVR